MNMEVVFPGGKRVDAIYKDFTIKTDQPPSSGDKGAYPSPFDLFLASIGTCAGFYVLSFCQQRNIPAENIRLKINIERDKNTHMVKNININIVLPSDFPGKYEKAVVRAAEQCTVKKHLLNPPAINIKTEMKKEEELESLYE